MISDDNEEERPTTFQYVMQMDEAALIKTVETQSVPSGDALGQLNLAVQVKILKHLMSLSACVKPYEGCDHLNPAFRVEVGQ